MQHNIRLRLFLTATVAITWSIISIFAQETDSLSHYLEVAGRNNPGLNADFLTYKASLEKVPQAGSWPDPELDIGFFLKPMDIVGGRQIADFTLMQMFPWFGTKKTAQTEATHMAKMAYEQFRETRDNLYLEVYTQWYVLSTLVEQLNNNRENLQLLKQLEELALRKVSSPFSGSTSGYSVPAPSPATKSSSSSPTGGGMAGMGSMGGSTTSSGTSSSSMSSMSGSGGSMSSGMGSIAPGMSDVLRVQLEVVEIENNIESILSEIAAEKARFNALLSRSTGLEVTLPDSIAKVSFLFDEAVSQGEIENQNPMLGMLMEEEQVFRAKGEMEKKNELSHVWHRAAVHADRQKRCNTDGSGNGQRHERYGHGHAHDFHHPSHLPEQIQGTTTGKPVYAAGSPGKVPKHAEHTSIRLVTAETPAR